MLTFFIFCHGGGDIFKNINTFNRSCRGQREKSLGKLCCEKSILKMDIWKCCHCGVCSFAVKTNIRCDTRKKKAIICTNFKNVGKSFQERVAVGF